MSYDELIEEAYEKQVREIFIQCFSSLMLNQAGTDERLLNGLKKAKEVRQYLKDLLL